MALTNEQITAKNFKKFYEAILPYLNGEAHAGFTPVGTVISVMGNSAPQNYLACNGQVVNIADYPELANYFEAQFGTKNNFGGNGTTTFGVPDLRGEFLRGTGTNSHTYQGSGANVGVHQDATVDLRYGALSNYLRIYKGSSSSSGDYVSPVSGVDSAVPIVDGRASFNQIPGTFSNESAGASGYTARPTNTSVLYCIATKNIYIDSRFVYSTDERVVGTWIDGKTLFQKTLVIDLSTFATIDASRQYIDLLTVTESTGDVFIVSGYHLNDNDNCFNPIVEPVGDGAYSLIRVVKETSIYKIQGLSEGTNWLRQSINNKSGELILTIQYTKTTD